MPRNLATGSIEPEIRAIKSAGEKKKAGLTLQTGPGIIPAATYVPTQLPAQYHRPGEA
jgi:hypothetical protein